MLATETRRTKKVRRSQVHTELSARAQSKDNIAFSLTKEMSEKEIHDTLLSKLFSVRKELGLI
jgi:hypothetical protein